MNNKNTINIEKTLYGKFINFWVTLFLKFPLPNALKKFVTFETFSYLFIGVLTTIVNYITYVICQTLLLKNYQLSTIISWIVAVMFAFYPNKIFVYKNNLNNYNVINLLKEFSSFTLSRLFSGLCEFIFMIILVDFIGLNDYLSKVIVSIFVIITNYLTGKLFVFKKS